MNSFVAWQTCRCIELQSRDPEHRAPWVTHSLSASIIFIQPKHIFRPDYPTPFPLLLGRTCISVDTSATQRVHYVQSKNPTVGCCNSSNKSNIMTLIQHRKRRKKKDLVQDFTGYICIHFLDKDNSSSRYDPFNFNTYQIVMQLTVK